MKRILNAIGPAIIVAAVVLGPGSILTSSKVGASLGLLGLPVVAVASVLMIAMVALSARLGAVYENSPCDELASRLGRPVAVAIGLTLFTIVAFFQSSNNIALLGGIEPLFGDQPLSFPLRTVFLLVVNGLVIASLYLLKNLYGSVESLMKLLIGMMTLAFLFNFVVIFSSPTDFQRVVPDTPPDWFALLGMIGTTFSVGGAFYQAYLVKEKGWGLGQVRQGVIDSVVSISMLGMVTAMILLTSWRVFYGNPDAVALLSVGDVARQLEPLFGSSAKAIFCIGILAGGLSSFLVNALIGGTVMSDSLGKGSKLDDKWPLHLTTAALLVGMGVAIASVAQEGSTVHLITIAQACTVLGIPALAAALIYLGTRKELTGARKVPRWILVLAMVGFLVSCLLAGLTADKVYQKLSPPPTAAKKGKGVFSVVAGPATVQIPHSHKPTEPWRDQLRAT
ncbi:divalent metal cation transporter [Stieleria sp. TO1_6]|uniref:NRAMP family divalent metal transporter n=1 Tax=Stieleria tagensis TaxID=2956795 RepID=UPI00209A9475|nr:divalent metal cation transporter [Stieleria tagensis]MCO8120614.1 divalent metal cation transporter [Stieleria tagensis]